MLRTLLPASTLLCVILLPLAGHAAQLDELKSLNLELPSSDMTFSGRPGSGCDEQQLPRLSFGRSHVESAHAAEEGLAGGRG